MPFIVHQSATRVAGVDGRIGLDEVLKLLDLPAETAACGADDSLGHSLAYAEGIADGECDIAHFNLARIGQGQCREIRPIDLNNRDVGALVRADDPSLKLA